MKKELKITYQVKATNAIHVFIKSTFTAITLLLSFSVMAQVSGAWDGNGTNGTTGYTNHGSGVIQLLDTNNTGCAAAAVHETTDTYDPTIDGVFNKCYQVYFGCPGDDQIGSDTKGDGMAFSFWRNSATYNINNGQACGGGLGYMGSASDNRMITIEFDTWSSQGNAGFDGSYGGGVTGNNDEVALHRDGVANDGGRITSTNAGNLEDGLEHTVCINYDPSTDIYTIQIDGNTVLTYDATGTGNELESYFGAGGLNQTWSSGKFGATNPATVSDENQSDISTQVGGSLCGEGVVITSPSDGSVFSSCSGPITITAEATPPPGQTVTSVEFFVDGGSIGVDNTFPYEIVWPPANGSHTITAEATWSLGGTFTSPVTNITVGGGIEFTSTAPVIDGVAEPLWGSYIATSLNNELPIPGAVPVTGPADLSATYQVMWDATNLYILMDVTDDDIVSDGGNNWDNDGIEIFIDMGNDKAGTYGADDYQYAFVYNNPTPIEYYHGPGSLVGVTHVQTTTAGGYIIEVSIPWSSLGGAPVDGELIGFDAHVNEDDLVSNGSNRDAKIAWNDQTDQAFNNPSVFGTLQVSDCNPLLSAMITPDALAFCEGGNVRLVATPQDPSYTYEWFLNGVSLGAPQVADSIYFATSGGDYTVEVDDGSTQDLSDTVTIIENPRPNGVILGENGVCPDDREGYRVNAGMALYAWDVTAGATILNGNGTDSITVQFGNSPSTVSAIIMDINGCIDTATYNVDIECQPTIPNIITPNGDNVNDTFEILGITEGTVVEIYNRWGKTVYLSDDYDNSWSAADLADGIYYVYLKMGITELEYKGYVYVVR